MTERRRHDGSLAAHGVRQQAGADEYDGLGADHSPGLRASFIRGYAVGYYGSGSPLGSELRQLDLPSAAAYRRGRLAGRATRQRVRSSVD